MANTRLTDENVIDILGATNLESKEIHTHDPIVKSRIRVTLDQLRPYDNNPRTTQNPKFDEIMISIENTGLNQPPNISRRSQDDLHYMIIDGGNTRLEILNLLYEKYSRLAEAATDEERLELAKKAESFFVIECIFKPWVSESKALTGHMSENENRGNMLFIEKAIAVQKLRQIYEEEDRKKVLTEGNEYEKKPLSIRNLAERITAQGWTINHSHIIRYDYATNTLMKAIPDAFWTGAGHSLVINLKKHNVAYTTFWRGTKIGQTEPERIDTLFLDTLRRYDGESVDLQGFLQDLNAQLAKFLDLHPSIVTVEIEAIMNGRVASPTPQESPGLSRDELIKKYKETAPPGVLGAPDAVFSHAGSGTQTTGGKEQQKVSEMTKSKPDRGQRSRPVGSVTGGVISHKRDENTEERLLEMVRTLATRYDINIIYLTPEERGGSLILFGVAPIDRALIPGEDEELATVWWALTKYSLSYRGDQPNRYSGFIMVLKKQFSLYIERLEGPLGTLLFFEEAILAITPELRDQLFEIQRLCGLRHQEITADK